MLLKQSTSRLWWGSCYSVSVMSFIIPLVPFVKKVHIRNKIDEQWGICTRERNKRTYTLISRKKNPTKTWLKNGKTNKPQHTKTTA